MRVSVSLVASILHLLRPVAGLPQQQPAQISVTDSAAAHAGIISEDNKAYIADVVERFKFAGVSVAVVTSPLFSPDSSGNNSSDGGWRSETLTFGVANAAGHPVDEDTLFGIGSNSKHFTALAIGLLIEDGVKLPNGEPLGWNSKMKDVLPDLWQLADPYASDHADITDLLGANDPECERHADPQRCVQACHVTMRRWGGYWCETPADGSVATPEEVIRNLRNLPTKVELREYWQYNNQYYVTLSHVVKALTGEAFIDYVQRRILDPVGMKATTYNATVARGTGLLTDGHVHTGMNLTRCAERWNGTSHLDPGCVGERRPIGWWTETDGVFDAGPGGMITSAKDMTKWLAELLEPKVLPASLLEKTAQGVMANGMGGPGPEFGPAVYGFGQVATTYRGEVVVMHGGGLPGQVSRVVRLPARGVAVAVMMNDEYLDAPGFVVLRVIDDVLGLPPVDWEGRASESFLAAGPPPQAPRPPHPAPPRGGFDAIPGMYESAGYGPPRALTPADDVLSRPDIQRAYESLGRVPATPAFVLAIDNIYAAYLVLEHFDAELFNATIISVASGGPEPVTTALGTIPAVIAPEGIGLFGGAAGYDPAVPLPPVSVVNVADAAEVFFARV